MGVILPALCPTMFALAVTRINTLCDSLIAWGLLEQGAASAVYCAERLCHLPIGLIGLTIATVVFPSFSRHAAVEDRRALTDDLMFGVRLVLLLAVPASAGLWLLAEPLTALLFLRGEFTPQDVARTAQLVRGYGLGTWACCALPVLLRAYYALGKRRSPLLVGCGIVAANLALNLLLVWPLGERALALSTSACAVMQCLLLGGLLLPRLDGTRMTELIPTAVRSAAGTAVMCLVTFWFMQNLAFAGNLVQTLGTIAAAVAVYGVLMWRWFRRGSTIGA